MEPLSSRIDEGDARRRRAALYGRPAQFQRGSILGGGGDEMGERQGFSETPGLSRRGDMAHGLALDGEFGAVFHHIAVVGNDAE